MAASVSGSKTCSTTLSPSLTASTLTTLLAIAPENMTLKQVHQLNDALLRVKGGGEMLDGITTIGSLLS